MLKRADPFPSPTLFYLNISCSQLRRVDNNLKFTENATHILNKGLYVRVYIYHAKEVYYLNYPKVPSFTLNMYFTVIIT
jgi:hypothetical protein